MMILGITGGVATGKSAVTQMFAELGAPTISADEIARALLAPGAPLTRLVLAEFPHCADPADPTHRTVDRRALGRLIFTDTSARARLEALTHPAIVAQLAAQFELWRPLPAPRAAAEIPLLFEAGLTSLVDQIVVVACAEETQIARLTARLGISEDEARLHIAAQWPLADKIAQADFVITTDTGLEDTRRQVAALWDGLLY